MGGYKGQRSTTAVDAGWPFQVRLTIPRTGLGEGYGAIEEACAGRECVSRPDSSTLTHRSRWCFRTRANADAFHERFSALYQGERIDT